MFVYMYACIIHVHTTVSVWRSEGILWELVLSSTTWVPGIELRFQAWQEASEPSCQPVARDLEVVFFNFFPSSIFRFFSVGLV